MRILVTGKGGFVGKHVVKELERRGVEIADEIFDWPDAVIHLAWRGLPNYESEVHEINFWPQVEFLKMVSELGIENVTVAGTCLEEVANPPMYALVKSIVRREAMGLISKLKWVRLWQLYGEGQRDNCLLPSLRRAIERGDKSFRVIDGSRDFMDAKAAASRLVDAAMQTEVTGAMDCCTGVAEPVISFCRRQIGTAPISLETGYPMPSYEPRVFCGDPTKMNSIHEYQPA